MLNCGFSLATFSIQPEASPLRRLAGTGRDVQSWCACPGRVLTLILIEEQSLHRAENQRGPRDSMLTPSQNHSFIPSSKNK